MDVTHNTFELNDLSWGKKDFVDDYPDIYFTKIQFAFFLLLVNNCYIDWENSFLFIKHTVVSKFSFLFRFCQLHTEHPPPPVHETPIGDYIKIASMVEFQGKTHFRITLNRLFMSFQNFAQQIVNDSFPCIPNLVSSSCCQRWHNQLLVY